MLDVLTQSLMLGNDNTGLIIGGLIAFVALGVGIWYAVNYFRSQKYKEMLETPEKPRQNPLANNAHPWQS